MESKQMVQVQREAEESANIWLIFFSGFKLIFKPLIQWTIDVTNPWDYEETDTWFTKLQGLKEVEHFKTLHDQVL